MNINEIPRGQLPTIILSSLLDGDKYGYEIIESIEKRTNGEIVVKKPSLYSTLTRLEKQDLVSSYWKDSDIGGRRHYYRLTDFGKKQVLQWQQQLFSSQNKLAKILQINNLESLKTAPLINENLEVSNLENKDSLNNEKQQQTNETNATFLKQESLFNLTKEQKEQKEQEKQESKATSALIKDENLQNFEDTYIQYDLFAENSFITQPENNTKNIQTEKEINISDSVLGKDNGNLSTFLEAKDDESEEKQNSLKQEKTQTQQNLKEKELEEKSNLFKQSLNELLQKETASFEDRLQKAKKSFNFETEYKKHIKATKSFAETFEEGKTNSFSNLETYINKKDIINGSNFKASSFIEDMKDDEKLENTKILNQNLTKLHNQFEENLDLNEKSIFNSENLDKNSFINDEENKDLIVSSTTRFSEVSDEEINFEEELFNNEENYNKKDYNKEIKSEPLHNDLSSDIQVRDETESKTDTKNKNELQLESDAQIKLDDSVLITDKIEAPPKVKKIAPASFLHLNKNQLPTRRSHTQEITQNHSSLTQKTFSKNEAFDEDKTFSHKNQPAKEYFDTYNIKIGGFQPETKNKTKSFKTSGKSNFVNLKKCKFMFSSAALFLLILQIAVLTIILNYKEIEIFSKIWLIVTVLSLAFLWTLFNLIIYLKDKNDKTLKNSVLITPLWQKIILMVIFLILVYSVHLLAGLDLNNISDFIVTLSIPVIICFDVLVYHFAQFVLLKT